MHFFSDFLFQPFAQFFSLMIWNRVSPLSFPVNHVTTGLSYGYPSIFYN